MVCPRDHCLSCLERLAQGIEHLRMKFRKLVEEEQAEMGERCLAGTGRVPPTTSAAMLAEWCG